MTRLQKGMSLYMTLKLILNVCIIEKHVEKNFLNCPFELSVEEKKGSLLKAQI